MPSAKPFQALNYGQPFYESGDLVVAQLKANIGEGAYNFKGNTFQTIFYSLTGIVDGDNHWLIGCASPGESGGTFDLDIFEYKDGKKQPDKPKSDEMEKRWMKAYQPTAILVNGIESMEVLVKVCHELKLVVKALGAEGQIFHTVKLKEGEKAETEALLSDVLMAYMNGFESNPNKPLSGNKDILPKVNRLSELGMFYGVVVDPNYFHTLKIESQITDDIFWNLPPIKYSDITQVSPHDGITITLPTVKVRGNGGSYGASVKMETTTEKIEARVEFLKKHYSKSDLAGVLDEVASSKAEQLNFDNLIKILG